MIALFNHIEEVASGNVKYEHMVRLENYHFFAATIRPLKVRRGILFAFGLVPGFLALPSLIFFLLAPPCLPCLLFVSLCVLACSTCIFVNYLYFCCAHTLSCLACLFFVEMRHVFNQMRLLCSRAWLC